MNLMTMILACSVYPHNSIVNAMVDINSQNNPLVISGEVYKTPEQALIQAKALQAGGTAFDIGLMQIPSIWLKEKPVSLNELLRPCKNMVLATQILNKLNDECHGDQTCALSMYKTGDKDAGLAYANQVIDYASAHRFVAPVSADE